MIYTYLIVSVVCFSRRYRYWSTLHFGMYTVWDLYCMQQVVLYSSVVATGIGLHCTSGCTLFGIYTVCNTQWCMLQSSLQVLDYTALRDVHYLQQNVIFAAVVSEVWDIHRSLNLMTYTMEHSCNVYIWLARYSSLDLSKCVVIITQVWWGHTRHSKSNMYDYCMFHCVGSLQCLAYIR